MNMLVETLELIVESEGFSRVYNEIRNNIVNSQVGSEEGGMATNSWLAGMLASRGSSEGKLARAVSALDSGQLDPESKEYRDAVRTKIAFQTLYKYGMVKQDERGRFTFPSSSPADSRKRQMLSKFRDFLSTGFNDDKEKNDLTKSFRNTKDEVSQEWVASLPPERKKMLDAFSEMSVSAFTMLRSLFSVRGPSDVAAFRHRINSAKFSEATDLQTLKSLGFVGENGLMNRGMVKRFGEFLKDPDGTGADNALSRLMPFNKELTYFIKRSTADKALARNAAGKELDHLNDQDAPQTKDDMSDEQNRAVNSRITDIEGGTKSSTRNDRAGDQKRNYSDLIKQAFN